MSPHLLNICKCDAHFILNYHVCFLYLSQRGSYKRIKRKIDLICADHMSRQALLGSRWAKPAVSVLTCRSA